MQQYNVHEPKES